MPLDFNTTECPACNGDRIVGHDPGGWCERCKGRGRVLLCTVCSGDGEVFWDDETETKAGPCEHCGGTGAEPMPDPNDRY